MPVVNEKAQEKQQEKDEAPIDKTSLALTALDQIAQTIFPAEKPKKKRQVKNNQKKSQRKSSKKEQEANKEKDEGTAEPKITEDDAKPQKIEKIEKSEKLAASSFAVDKKAEESQLIKKLENEQSSNESFIMPIMPKKIDSSDTNLGTTDPFPTASDTSENPLTKRLKAIRQEKYRDIEMENQN